MQFTAPAKINLSLRVLNKRADGFHEIETLMAPVAIRDTLDIERRDGGGIEFTCSDATLPTDGTNLVVRAARAFFGATGTGPDVRIFLQKEIPHGAGLGGGSSDAAATLLALDALFETHLPHAELTRIAAEIGSDIPFFLARGVAWCRGRGERVEPCVLPGALPLLLIKPPFGVPTPWAYQRWRDSVEIPGVPYAPQALGGITLVNDLERPVFGKFIQLAEMKRWLLGQPEAAGALMSGSGSTLFAVLREKADGPALLEKARAQFGPHAWLALTETV
jgi:4-diphosphocytidyl-2-C-methyl-D-erythritol kinase